MNTFNLFKRNSFPTILILLVFNFVPNLIQGQKGTTELCGVCCNIDAGKKLKSSPDDGYKNLLSEPKVIDISTDESFFFKFHTFFDDVASVEFVGSNFFDDIQINGNPITDLLLLDNGQGNDAVAGDKIFTSESMVFATTNFDYIAGGFMRFTTVRYSYSNGDPTQTISIDLGAGIRLINGINVDVSPSLYQLTNKMQASNNVVNVVNEVLPLNPLSGINAPFYYEYFPDDQDFMSYATTFPTPGSPAAAFSHVNVDIEGIFSPPVSINNSAFHGSAGNLKGNIDYYYTGGGNITQTKHEILHYFAAYLNDDLNLDISATGGGSHWSIIERPTSGFGVGVQCTDIIDLGNDCYDTDRIDYTSDYNDLEMYLMGLIPITDITWPIRTLADWTFNGFGDPCTFTSPIGIEEVTQADFLASMGPRVPDHTTAQSDFDMGLIVISDRFLTPKEMAYYQFQMEQNELPIGSPDRVDWGGSNFEEATGGRGTLDTKLDLCQGLFCRDMTKEIDASGMLTITNADIGSALNSDCGFTNISIDQTSFDCTNINVPSPPRTELIDTISTGSSRISEIAVKDSLIYLANFTLDQIDVFDQMGELQFSFGDSSNFSIPGSIAFASNGNIYVVDSGVFGQKKITVFDSVGTFLFDFTTAFSPENIFIYNDLLYVAMVTINSVGVYDLSGNFIEYLFTTPDMFGLYIENDLIYTVGDAQNSTAYVHDLNGVEQFNIPTNAWTSDISADTCGNIFIVAAAENIYQVYDDNGIFVSEENLVARSLYNQQPNLLYAVGLFGEVTKIEVTCSGEFFVGLETITVSGDDPSGNSVSCTSTLLIEDPDNVCNCTDDNLTLSSDPIPSNFYEVSMTINSAGVVMVNGDVTFAGATICLDNGFEVEFGATFEAIIDPCGL